MDSTAAAQIRGGMSTGYRTDYNRYGMSKPHFDTSQPISTLLQPRRAERVAYFGGRTPWADATNPAIGSTAVFGPFGGLSARNARLRSGSLIHPTAVFPTPGGVNAARTRYAFATYGGFGPRTEGAETADLGAALLRRNALVQSQAMNAPIHRANIGNASVAGLRASFDQAPLPMPPLSPDAPEPTRTLGQELVQNIELSHDQALEHGWALFREGAYRQAARAFESAARLQADDWEARVGLVFCHVSLGATRTSLALIAEFNRRMPNPFSLDLNVAEKYGRREQAVQLALQARFQATAVRDNVPLVALSAFVLWYLGEHEQAISTASALRGEGGSFGRWAEKMQAVRSAQPP